jgi:hypothetical protein
MLTYFYEIEMKSLLTKQQYDDLFNELPKKMKHFNEETIHTTRYRPGDLRLRYSDKTIEVVCKEGNPTTISRREVQIPLSSMNHLEYFAKMFELQGMKADPFWIKYKNEFEYFLNGFTYIVCLQDIKDFAYLLEVEFLSKTNDAKIHEPNLRRIYDELGCEPIEPEDFSSRIQAYIDAKK